MIHIEYGVELLVSVLGAPQNNAVYLCLNRVLLYSYTFNTSSSHTVVLLKANASLLVPPLTRQVSVLLLGELRSGEP